MVSLAQLTNAACRRRNFLAIGLAWLAFAGLAVSGAVAQQPPTAAQQPVAAEQLELFLLVGQSNMAGRGLLTPEDCVAPPRVVALNAQGAWVPAIDPLHFDKPAAVGVGLGRTFGIEIAQTSPQVTIGLIPCAVGGSPIDAWTPGTHYPPTNSHPWDDAIRRARLAMRSGKLKGILWHQGESDAQPGLAEAYQAKLDDLIARFRKELGDPDLPFIVGQMGQFPEQPWGDAKRQVDRAHRELPTRVPRTAFVSSDGLAHKGDEVHFDAAGYRELGRRYAQAYRELTRLDRAAE